MESWMIGLLTVYFIVGIVWGCYINEVVQPTIGLGGSILRGMLWPFDATRIFLG